jgi:hypothetical protein
MDVYCHRPPTKARPSRFKRFTRWLIPSSEQRGPIGAPARTPTPKKPTAPGKPITPQRASKTPIPIPETVARPSSLYDRLAQAHRAGRDLALDAQWAGPTQRSRKAFSWYMATRSLIPPEYLSEFDEIHDSRALNQEDEINALLGVVERVMKDPKHR